MNTFIKYTALIYLFLSIHCLKMANSQVKTNVVTKEINKSYQISPKQDIIIYAEKANIIIERSDNNVFDINLKLISKNKDLSTAKKQLEYLKYIIDETRTVITVRNFINLADSELSGTINAEYILKIPDGHITEVQNILGDIDIKGTACVYKLNIQYGNIKIKNTRGDISIYQKLGDLIINDCNGKFIIENENVTVNAQNNKGSYNFDTKMGSLNFNLNNFISTLNIKSTGTQINISNPDKVEFDWEINSELGDIYIDENNLIDKKRILIDNRSKHLKDKVFSYKIENSGRVKIVNKYSNIFIN